MKYIQGKPFFSQNRLCTTTLKKKFHIKLDIWCIYLLEKCVMSVTKHQKMDSIFIWLPLVYTTNDQLNLTFVIFVRHI